MRFDFVLLRGHVKARRSINSMPVEQSHGRHAVFGTSGDEVLGQGSSFEKTECGAGVEFDVRHGDKMKTAEDAEEAEKLLGFKNPRTTPCLCVGFVSY